MGFAFLDDLGDAARAKGGTEAFAAIEARNDSQVGGFLWLLHYRSYLILVLRGHENNPMSELLLDSGDDASYSREMTKPLVILKAPRALVFTLIRSDPGLPSLAHLTWFILWLW